MIEKYTYGNPFNTEAIPVTSTELVKVCDAEQLPKCLELTKCDDGHIELHITMEKRDMIFGLGEALRGINKRGWIYESWCSDEPNQTEEKRSIYGAHNFLIVACDEPYGIFIDNPGRVTYDVGYTDMDTLSIKLPDDSMDLYVIYPSAGAVGEELKDIVHQFRRLIGKSYMPPLWAFGYAQSRWGYKNEADIREIADRFDAAGIPIDMIYMDIDYMQDYKDFTVNPERFPDLPGLVEDMKSRGIRLIPIIDAGVRVEDGYDVYEEGRDGGYFCRDKDGNDFTGSVWPGKCCFPDFLNPEARKWFGEKYKLLTDMGIEGFWNDMNEPAIFFSEDGFEDMQRKVSSMRGKDIDLGDYFEMKDKVGSLANSMSDYMSIYHKVGSIRSSADTAIDKVVRHDRVHNIYGYNMMRSMREGCRNDVLLLSRASYIGAHRYGGIWQGDNQSWWSHLELNVKMMPSLNMCGFIYTGADTGGFGSDTTEELLQRWLQFSVFTPLMRNHSALGTREQEPFRFGNVDDMRFIISLRYVLLPYIYESAKRAVERDELMFTPLAFEYSRDSRACEIEDQLMMGDALMLAPVVKPNTTGRMVYLPEDMMEIRFHCRRDKSDESSTSSNMDSSAGVTEILTRKLKAGDHYIDYPLDELVVFLRKGKALQLADGAMRVGDVDMEHLSTIKY